MISSGKRKTLPEIARIVGLGNEQALHHFLTKSPWAVKKLRKTRLNLILHALKGRKIFLIIDETGDKKKGRKTDYVSRQYLGKLGKIDNGIVAVTAWGLITGITFPVIFEVYKPKERLLAGDTYRARARDSSAEGARNQASGDSSSSWCWQIVNMSESESKFVGCLEELILNFVVAIRRNHGVWLPKGQTVRCNRWHPSCSNGGNRRTALARKFNRIFSDKSQEVRYIREIIFWKKRNRRFWEITTDLETMPENST